MSKPTYVEEYQAITEVLNKYIEGCKQAKSSIMKPAFSEQATMFSVDGDGKLAGVRFQYCSKGSTRVSALLLTHQQLSSASKSSVRRLVLASTPTTCQASLSPTFSSAES